MSAQPARPLFVAAGEGRKSAWATIKADGTATGGAFALVETVIPRGADPSWFAEVLRRHHVEVVGPSLAD